MAETYVDPFEAQRKANAAALAVSAGATTSADKAAQAAQLARRFNLPPAVADQFADDYKARAATEDARAIFQRSPSLSSWIADRPDQARIAHDDLSTLSGLEQVLRSYSGAAVEGAVGSGAGATLSGFGRLYDAAARGLAAPLRAAGLGALDVPIPSWMSPNEQLLKAPGRYLQAVGKKAGPDPENRSFGTDVASGLGQMAFQIGAYLLTGGASGTAMLYAGGAESMGAKVDGDATSQAAKDTATVAGAAVTGITEKYALDKILGPLAVPVRNAIGAALARIGVAASAEGFQELTESIGQDAIRKVLTNSDAPIDIPGAVYEGGVGATVGGIVRSVVEAALHVKRRGAVQQQQAQGADTVQRVVAAATDSKLRERDPQAFAELVQQTASASGAPTEVYIDARQVAEALQQSGFSEEQLTAAMPSMAGQFAEALEIGGDVAIPLGEFAAAVAGSPLEQALMQHVRTAPDALSPAEAGKSKGAEAELQAAADRATAQADEQTAATADRDAVSKAVLDQLNATGRFTPDVHAAYADATAAIFANLARRKGVTAQELWKQYDLKVNASGVFGEVLQQRQAASVTASPEFKAWFGASKVTDASGAPMVVYHGSPDARFANEDGIFSTFKDRMLRFGATPESRKDATDGRAFFFTSSRGVATTYADDRRAFDYQNADAGVIPAYVAMSNPLVFDAKGMHWREAQKQISKDDFVKQAKKAGHDGVLIRNVRDSYDSMAGGRDPVSDVVVAFSSNQIKHAERNSGAFNPADPSILKQSDPSPVQIEQMKREKVLSRLLECLGG